MGATVSKQKQKKTPIHTNSSSLVPSAADNSIAALTQPERTIVSQVLLDQQKENIHTTPVSAEMMSVNVVEKAETVADTEKERANMLDPNHFSIKGVTVKYFSSLVDVWGGCSELKGMTTQDICNKFVKPQTESSKLSWCADMYLSKDPNLMGQVHDANYFISHAWKYTFLDVVEALTNFVDSNKLDPEATIIWFDLLSNSQHNTSAKDFTWWTTVFQNAIQKIGSVVLIMQPWDDPIPLTRAWCVYEIYVSNVAGSSFYVAMPPNETILFMDSLKKQSQKYLSLLANLNSQNCKAGNTSDQEAIFTTIERTIGFSKLDRTVLETLAVWIIGTLQDHITSSRSSQNHILQIDWMLALAGFYRILSHYEKAESMYVECLETSKRVLGPDHPDTLIALNNLALLYYSQGKYEQAEPMYNECLSTSKRVLGPDHPDTLTIMSNLALLYKFQGKYVQSEPMYTDCLATSKKVLGPDHPDTLLSLNNMADLYYSQGKYDQAESMYIECLSTSKRVLGPDHPDTLVSLNNLALIYNSQGKYEQAEPISVQCLKTRQRVLGPDHPDTLISLNNLALLYYSQGKYDQAESMYIECLSTSKRVLGPDHPDTLVSLNNLALLYNSQGKYEQAEPISVQCLKTRQRVLGPDHPDTLIALNNLALLYYSQGKYEQAEPIYIECLSTSKRVLGPDHPDTLTIMSNWAKSHVLAVTARRKNLCQ
ncbi:TPR-like protein [Rhizoclosmatium globosum]|uniref:TPR-like protein n=1 Tax=Rhizoclosmatium globosum TaxID=329046 RepID=A0A1Y2BAS0_9FUNG|nr:TPR-like protein [Rhizoclosmatium globosum]|eukprot:ORY31577.1 TPR-like protein [Rhizoclosmatium globosum]